MATRLANKILFGGCVSPEGQDEARRLADCVKKSEVLINADEAVARFMDLAPEGPGGWEGAQYLPNVAPPQDMERVFMECRVPQRMPDRWASVIRELDVDAWGISLHYQDLIRYFSEDAGGTGTYVERMAAHYHAQESITRHMGRNTGPQQTPSATLRPYVVSEPATRWFLESELFLHSSKHRCVVAGAYGMDAILTENGRFAPLIDGSRAVYYRTTPLALEADLGASREDLAAAAALGTTAAYVPLLASLCLSHHDESAPLSYIGGVSPSKNKAGGIAASRSWRTLDIAPTEAALSRDGGLGSSTLREALEKCADSFNA